MMNSKYLYLPHYMKFYNCHHGMIFHEILIGDSVIISIKGRLCFTVVNLRYIKGTYFFPGEEDYYASILENIQW